MLSPHTGLNASFAHIDALPGELAFVTQSGALMTAMLDWARSRRIGFSHLVSLGEHADIDFGDLLDYLSTDVRTQTCFRKIPVCSTSHAHLDSARNWSAGSRVPVRYGWPCNQQSNRGLCTGTLE